MSDVPREPLPAPEDEELDPFLDQEPDEPEDDPPPDEGEDDPADPDEGEDDGGEPQPERQRQGRRRQADRLRTRLDERDREVADLRRQMDELRQGVRQPAIDPLAAQRAEQEFFASLEMMAPAQAYQAIMQRGRAEFARELRQRELNTSDALDRQAYETRAANSPLHQRYQRRVEQMVADERRAGNVVSRMSVFRYLLGMDAEQRATRAAPAQRRNAARRVAGARTTPASGRGDGARAGNARDQDAADERLLRGIRAGDF